MNALPPEVATAPQLAILAALDAVLEHAVIALVAAHPEIDDVQSLCAEPPPVWLADSVVNHARLLQQSLRRYRCALDDELEFRTPSPIKATTTPNYDW
jgi:hypothetical protein